MRIYCSVILARGLPRILLTQNSRNDRLKAMEFFWIASLCSQ
ncbi:hypothetical protein OFO12_05865 [Campylobacter sp. JMF_04 NA10]|nr:hypothetical protein [Campylobacter sp. JMF_04 NA10]